MRATGQGLDIERLGVVAVDPIADAAEPREILEVLVRGRAARHLPDRATDARQVSADVGREVLAGERGAGRDEVGGRALEHDPAAVVAGARARGR